MKKEKPIEEEREKAEKKGKSKNFKMWAAVTVVVILLLCISGGVLLGVLLGKKHTVVFKNGDIEISSQTVKDGGFAVAPEAPVKDSDGRYTYVFAGWALSPDGETVDVAATKIEGDTVFYAMFGSSEIEHTVTIRRDGEVIKTLKVGSGATLTEEELLDGCDDYGVVSIIDASGDTSSSSEIDSDISVTIAAASAGLSYTMSSDGALEVKGTETCVGTVVIPLKHGGKYVTRIGDAAFAPCPSVTAIVIPSSVTSLGDFAFAGDAHALTAINVSAGSAAFKDIDGVLYSKDGTTIISFPNGRLQTSYDIADGVTGIGNAAFFRCKTLTGITIPTGVTTIGDYAFFRCKKLTGITIPNVTTIGNSAFSGCSGLTNITIPNATILGDYVFSNCSGLTNITIPNVTTIGDNAFEFCTGLTGIVIPEGVTDIGDCAFQNCTRLTDIVIPEGVTRIGYKAFINCSALTSITIPKNVTTIGDRAFFGCGVLASINYGGTVENWNAVNKASDWNVDTGNYNVHCSDGDIPKS